MKVKPWMKSWWFVLGAIVLSPIWVPLAIVALPIYIIYYTWAKSSWHQYVKIGVTAFTLLLCAVVFISGSASVAADKEEAVNLLNQSYESIEDLDFNAALSYARQSNKAYVMKEVSDLIPQIERATDTQFLKDNLVKLTDAEASLLENGNYQAKYFDDPKLNSAYITYLRNSLESREEFLQEEQERIAAEEAAEQERLEREAAEAAARKAAEQEAAEIAARTVSQRNAIRSAESYLDYTAFSRTGLIEQLEYEDYPTADATYAVDNIEVDWFEQAALSAENYLDYTAFSRSGLIDQLIYEGFTREQAEFGATSVGL